MDVAPTFPPAPDDAARQKRLDLMRVRATGLLVFAAVVFLLSHHYAPSYPWLDWVRAGAEASLVGGLADWFAVTALFRRPLGLPIPQTAIIMTQRDRIGRVLGNFVQRHFLTRDVVTAELQRLRPAERLARWLSSPDNSARVAALLQSGFARTVQAVPDEEFRALIRRAAVDRVEKTMVAPILGDMLAVVTSDDRHHELLDQALEIVVTALHENREGIRAQLHKEKPWYVPDIVDDVIYRQLLRATEKTLADVRGNVQHPLRVKFDDELRTFVEKLKHSPDMRAKAEAIKGQVLNAEVVEDIVDGVWDSVRASALRFGSDGEPPSAGLVRGLAATGTALLANDEVLAELDATLIEAVADAAERNRDHVGALIARTVQAWDPSVAASRLELAVGPDLQYIRINGTLVGALAGLGLYALTRVMG